MKAELLRGVLVALTFCLVALGTATYGQDSAGAKSAGGGRSPVMAPPIGNSGPPIIRRGDNLGGGAAGVDAKDPGGIAPRGDPFGIAPASDPFTISRIGGPPPGLLGPPIALADRDPRPGTSSGKKASKPKQIMPSTTSYPQKRKVEPVPIQGPSAAPSGATKPKQIMPSPTSYPQKRKVEPVPIQGPSAAPSGATKPKQIMPSTTSYPQKRKVEPVPPTDPITKAPAAVPQTDPITYDRR